MVYGVRISGNAFIAPEKAENPNIGIIIENPEPNVLSAEDNAYIGDFSRQIVRGVIGKHYVES